MRALPWSATAAIHPSPLPGIYGWMLHTRYFSSQFEAEGQYEAMKSALAMLLEVAEKTAEIDGGRQVLMAGVSKFVETFP